MPRLGVWKGTVREVVTFSVHAVYVRGTEVLLLLVRLLRVVRGRRRGVTSSRAATVTAVSTRHDVSAAWSSIDDA